MNIVVSLAVLEGRRIERGLTKKELAQRAGISPQRYQQMLSEIRAGRVPFVRSLKAVAETLGLSMDELLREVA